MAGGLIFYSYVLGIQPCAFFFFFYKFIYLFMATLGLGCCARAFSSWGEQGLLFVAVRGFLIAVASR